MRNRWWPSAGLVVGSIPRLLGAVSFLGALAAQAGEPPTEAPGGVLATLERQLAESEAAAERSDWDAARATCRRALATADLPSASQERIAAMEPLLLRLGRLAGRLGDPQTTLAALGPVLQRREATLPETDLDLQFLRNEVANALHALGDLRRARDLKQKMLRAFTATLPDDAPNLQMARGSLGSTLTALGELEEALALQQKVLAVFTATQPEEHALVQKARLSLAHTLAGLGRLPEASDLERKVLAVQERVLPAEDLALQRTRMGHAATLAELGDTVSALDLQRKVVDVFTRAHPATHPDLLLARANLANYLSQLGDLGGARDIQEEVLRSLTATLPPAHPQLIRARASLANTLLVQGDPARALSLHSQALDALTAELPADHLELQMARGNLAITMHQIGDWLGALALQEQVLQVFTRTLPPDHAHLRRARGNLATTLRSLGDLERALALDREVLQACERSLPKEHPDRSRARGNLASTLKALGKLHEALPLEQASLEALASRLPADHPELLTARQNHANTLHQVGQTDEALWLLHGTLRARQRSLPSDHPDLQGTYCLLALVHRDRGDAEKSAEHLLAAAAGALQFVENRPLAPRVGPALAMQTARMLSILADLLDPSMDLPEESATRLRAVGLRLVVASDNVELYASELRRSTALHHPEAHERLTRDLAVATQQLAAAVALPSEGRVDGAGKAIARSDAIRDATLAKDAIEREWLGLVAPDLRATPQTSALAAGLAPREVAVAFCQFPRRERVPEGEKPRIAWRYGAFVLDGDGRIAWHDLATEPEVVQLVTQLRDRAERRATQTEAPSEDQLLARLDALLLAPLRSSFPKGTERLVVKLIRDLPLIPFDMLPTASAFDIQLAWSLRSLVRTRVGRGEGASLLTVGEVDYDAAPSEGAPVVADTATTVVGNSGSSLTRARPAADPTAPKRFPGLANREARSVATIFEASFPSGTVTRLTGSGASEQALVTQARGAKWMHLVTHGYFAPEPVWSANAVGPGTLDRFAVDDSQVAQLTPFSLTGLALAGANLAPDPMGRREGLLTAQEAAALDLSACYLVTLSVCESSLGTRQAGDGLASLRNAFHAAGARFVVASLWNVPDRATEQLMSDFYTHLWKNGETPAQALRAAKQAARERRAPLREWAGFVLTGR